MLVSIFKLGVWKADKRTRRELWSSQEHNKEQIPNISHGIQRKWPFMDASKESFEFEFKKKKAIIWWRWSQAVSRGARGGLQESTDGWNQTQHRSSPKKPLLWKGCGCLSWRPVRHVRAESRRQLEELRWMRKHRMRKGSNWKPLR